MREAYNSDDSKFVALYGRRRVGKAYLIKQTFKDKFTFSHSVLLMGLQEQLYGWRSSLKNAGLLRFYSLSIGWRALDMLKELIAVISEEESCFIDEMPWMDTPRSKFVTALEFFWKMDGLQCERHPAHYLRFCHILVINKISGIMAVFIIVWHSQFLEPSPFRV